MGTIMSYNSKASMKVKPDMVSATVEIKGYAPTAKEVLDIIDKNRSLFKEFIMSKSSYIEDSYAQNSVYLHKNTQREYYYSNAKNTISEEQYQKLPQNIREEYIKQYREIFLNYSAEVVLYFSLTHNDTVVNDLVDIINMSTEKEFKCSYKHTISNELSEKTAQQLYIKCINDGVTNVTNIVNGLTFSNVKNNITLLEVRDPEVKTRDLSLDCEMPMRSKAIHSSSTYTPEQIISPDLIKELFNNNITIGKSLDMKFEF